MSDDAPDFAMLRAVEILANIYESHAKRERVPPPPSDKPIYLFSETLALEVHVTTKEHVQSVLGLAFSYPAMGWHTYGVRGGSASRLLLSLFYSNDRLASAELYVPKVERAPKLHPQEHRFRLVPGEIECGAPVTTLPEHFGRMEGVPPELGAYAQMFEARFPGGAAYAMANDGVIERLALYVLEAEERA
jgi:hypothetical protein